MTDEPTLIYLEADDEITAVVRRVRAADPGRVLIVAPGRSRATSSAVALRLLARAASDDEREIALVGDELTRSLAAEAGLTAYRSVDDARLAKAPTAEEAATAPHAAIHVVRGAAAEDTAPTLPAMAALDTETRPIRTVASLRERTTPERGARRRPPSTRTVRRPGRRAASPLVAVLGIAGAFLVIAAVLGAMLLPSATVAITPRSEPVGPVDYTITIDHPQRTSGTVNETATVTASGSYAIEAAATGTVGLRETSALVKIPPSGVPLEEIERSALMEALKMSNWVQKDAAELLGISPRVMNYKIKTLGIDYARGGRRPMMQQPVEFEKVQGL